MSSVTIYGNTTNNHGGGIYFSGSSIPIFDPDNRCNIYNNHAVLGNDLYAADTHTIAVVVDTFTVMNPTNHHVYPVDNFTIDILHAMVEQVSGDLYVSPDGDDSNSGQSPSEPLKTISHALIKIAPDSLHMHTIYLADGVYSPTTNGELFPLSMVSYVTLTGESENGVILDAEGKSSIKYYGVIFCYQISGTSIKNCTIKGGRTDWTGSGGGLYCSNSSILLTNVTICRNVAGMGGGIFGINSSILLEKNTITENTALSGGGICFFYTISTLENVTITGNTGNYNGGGIRCAWNSNTSLVNTIMWNNLPQEVILSDTSSISLAYSDVPNRVGGIEINNESTVNWLEGNIDDNPLFVDPENNDFCLQEGSPCIDAGTAFFVYEGDTLINLSPEDYAGKAPDMGVLEYGSIEDIDITPAQFSLNQNYPNPFNPSTKIEFTIPYETKITLTVYNILGQKVETLIDKVEQPGYYSIIWDATGMPSGIYCYILKTGDFTKVRKMVLLK